MLMDYVKKLPILTTRADDLDIAYREFGDGEPLLLIMGFGSTMDLWSPVLVKCLAEENRVIMFDNRGMGRTSAGSEVFSIERFADDAEALVSALDIEEINILGWSMGAQVAQETALRHPEKVRNLVLLAGSPGGEEGVTPSAEVLRDLADTSGTPAERGERLFRLMFPAQWLEENPIPSSWFPFPEEHADAASTEKQAVAMANWKGSAARLMNIQRPALMLQGTEDIIVPPANGPLLVGLIPGSWLVSVKNGGHGMMYQYPGYIADVVNFFLSLETRAG